MKTTIVKTRKWEKETYFFELNKPSYPGEKGCCGIEIEPYIQCITPESCCGYSDFVRYDSKNDIIYTSERYLQPWIKREIKKTIKKLMKKYEIY